MFISQAERFQGMWRNLVESNKKSRGLNKLISTEIRTEISKKKTIAMAKMCYSYITNALDTNKKTCENGVAARVRIKR